MNHLCLYMLVYLLYMYTFSTKYNFEFEIELGLSVRQLNISYIKPTFLYLVADTKNRVQASKHSKYQTNTLFTISLTRKEHQSFAEKYSENVALISQEEHMHIFIKNSRQLSRFIQIC